MPSGASSCMVGSYTNKEAMVIGSRVHRPALCASCSDVFWGLPHNSMCSRCKEAREIRAAFGHGDQADRWIAMLYPSVLLQESRIEQRTELMFSRLGASGRTEVEALINEFSDS